MLTPSLSLSLSLSFLLSSDEPTRTPHTSVFHPLVAARCKVRTVDPAEDRRRPGAWCALAALVPLALPGARRYAHARSSRRGYGGGGADDDDNDIDSSVADSEAYDG